MTYTIETRPTVRGPRYYIRCDGKLLRSGFANRTAAVERMKFLEVMDTVNDNVHREKQSPGGIRHD